MVLKIELHLFHWICNVRCVLYHLIFHILWLISFQVIVQQQDGLLSFDYAYFQQIKTVINAEKKLHLITTFNFIVDVSATAVAFFGMVLITSVRHQMSRRTARHRCGKVDRTPRLCSSTCLVPF